MEAMRDKPIWRSRLFFAAYILVVPAIMGSVQNEVVGSLPLSSIHMTILGDMMTLVLCAALSLKRDMFERYRWWPCVAYGLLVVGFAPFAMTIIWALDDLLPGVYMACGVCIGVGKALAFLLWARLYVRLAPKRMLLYSSATCVVAGVLAWTIVGLRAEWVAVSSVVLPLVTFVAFLKSREGASALSSADGDGTADVHERAGLLRALVPWRPVILMALVGFMAAFGPAAVLGVSIQTEAFALAPTGGAVFAGLLYVKGFRLDYVLKASFAAYVFGFLAVLMAVGIDSIAGFLVSVAYWGLSLFVFWLLCDTVNTYRCSVEWVFGISFALLDLMQFVGFLVATTFGGGRIIDLSQWEGRLALCLLAGAILTVALVALRAAERSDWRHWAREPIGEVGERENETADERIARLCRETSREAGLTFREEEILVLLLQRATLGEISNQLYVSLNTTKTHAKHIYAKLGVHSRDELRDRILG